jgi:hypothetical protein
MISKPKLINQLAKQKKALDDEVEEEIRRDDLEDTKDLSEEERNEKLKF